VPANIRADFTEQLDRAIRAAYMTMETDSGNTEVTNPPWPRHRCRRTSRPKVRARRLAGGS
jgi:hypothetical protein